MILKLNKDWAGHVERVGEMRKGTKIYLEYLQGRDHLRDLGVDENIILNGF
jgi:hypothetical protein